MKKLWFYFNTLQLSSTFTEFNLVKLPANVQMVKKSYDNIIHVKPIPAEMITKIKAQFGITTPTNSTDQDETSSPRLLEATNKSKIRKNQITLGAFVAVFAIALIIVIFLRHRIWQRLPQRLKDFLIAIKSLFIWNGVIRSLLELFYPTILLALGEIAKNRHNKDKLLIPLAQMSFYVGFLLFTLVHIEQHKEKTEDQAYKAKYGAFFTNVETFLKPSARHYSTFFLARRFVIAITIVFFKFSNVFQSLIAVYSSIMMMSWFMLVYPLDTMAKNYLEISNEFLIMILGYYGFLFTDYVGDPELRYTFGYIYIGILAGGLVLNVINLVFTSLVDFVRWCKYRRHILRQKKIVSQRLEQQKIIEESNFERQDKDKELPQEVEISSESSDNQSVVEFLRLSRLVAQQDVQGKNAQIVEEDTYQRAPKQKNFLGFKPKRIGVINLPWTDNRAPDMFSDDHSNDRSQKMQGPSQWELDIRKRMQAEDSIFNQCEIYMEEEKQSVDKKTKHQNDSRIVQNINIKRAELIISEESSEWEIETLSQGMQSKPIANPSIFHKNYAMRMEKKKVERQQKAYLINELEILAHLDEETKESHNVRHTRNIQANKIAFQGRRHLKNSSPLTLSNLVSNQNSPRWN